MLGRRQLLSSAALGFFQTKGIPTTPSTPHFDLPKNEGPFPYTPVETPNGVTMPWKLVDGVKEFHIVAEPVDREFTPGMIVTC